MKQMDCREFATVIMVKGRFFYGVSPKGRLQTSLSLAGARFFLLDEEEKLTKIEHIIRGKSHQPERRNVLLLPETVGIDDQDFRISITKIPTPTPAPETK